MTHDLLWLLLFVWGAVASAVYYPGIPSHLPPGALRLAFDEERNLLIAFDRFGARLGEVEPVDPHSNVHSRRDDSGCTPLNTADLQKLPGWQTLASAAETNFGDGQYNLVTNPPEYPNNTASVCISTNSIQLSTSGNPSCSTSSQSTPSTTIGSSGSASLTSSPGSLYSVAVTVTQQAAIVAGFQTSGTLQVPSSGSNFPATSINVPFENSAAGQSFSGTNNNQNDQPVTISAAPGSSCHLDFQTTSCTISGTGSVQYTATGWAWFNYLVQTQGHYKWALSIDGTLPVDQRSSSMSFNAKVELSTNSQFDSACVAAGPGAGTRTGTGTETSPSQIVLFGASSGDANPTSFDTLAPDQGGPDPNSGARKSANRVLFYDVRDALLGGVVGAAAAAILLHFLKPKFDRWVKRCQQQEMERQLKQGLELGG